VETVVVLVFPPTEGGDISYSDSALIRAGRVSIFLEPVEVAPPFRSNLTEVEKVEARRERRVRFSFQPDAPGRYEQEIEIRSTGSVGRYRLVGEALEPPVECLSVPQIDRFEDVRAAEDVLLIVDDHRSMEPLREQVLAEAST